MSALCFHAAKTTCTAREDLEAFAACAPTIRIATVIKMNTLSSHKSCAGGSMKEARQEVTVMTQSYVPKLRTSSPLSYLERSV
jgi:hypothetical protein